jgi:hypothetical protein
MDTQLAAEIQVVLEGVALPASRSELVRYAGEFDDRAAAALERIPDGDYASIDDVGEALVRTQPVRSEQERLPEPESGKPPGGPAYLEAAPRPDLSGSRSAPLDVSSAA